MKRSLRGFTLVELMVVVALAALIAFLAAPSFRDMILMQRLRGASAQFVTDMQFARSEAVARGKLMRVALGQNAGAANPLTCYTIFFVRTASDGYCDCTQGAGNACAGGPPGAVRREIRTVVLPNSERVNLSWPPEQNPTFAFDHVTGGLLSIPLDTGPAPLAQVVVETHIDTSRRLRTTIGQSGRPTVCSPDVQRMQGVACDPAPSPP